jgi:hypothetical protein
VLLRKRCSSKKPHTPLILMEVLKGAATGVRYTVHVSGDKDGVSTRHHAMFKLGATTVIFDAGAPPVISEGDHVVVAGRMKGRMLLADAILNQTVGVRTDSGMWLSFAAMLFCLPLGAAGLSWPLLGRLFPGEPLFNETLGWGLAVSGALFAAVGLYNLYKWLRIRGAVRLLSSR